MKRMARKVLALGRIHIEYHTDTPNEKEEQTLGLRTCNWYAELVENKRKK